MNGSAGPLKLRPVSRGRITLQTDHSAETAGWRSRAAVFRDGARAASARALKGTVARVRRGDRLSILLIVLGLVAVALIGRWFAAAGALKNAQHGRPPAAVNVARVELADMPVTVSAIGTVTPTDTATVRAQLAGNIVSIRRRHCCSERHRGSARAWLSASRNIRNRIVMVHHRPAGSGTILHRLVVQPLKDFL